MVLEYGQTLASNARNSSSMRMSTSSGSARASSHSLVSSKSSSHHGEIRRSMRPVGASPMIRGFSADRANGKLSPMMTQSYHSLKQQPPTGSGSLAEARSAYDRLVWQQQHDEQVMRDMTLGRRIGFYRFKSELGTGNFSKVKMALHLLTKEKVAVKIIDKSRLDAKTQRMVNREISIMDNLSHPCLIRLYEVSETLSNIYLMMEYASGGELFARLSDQGPYEEPEARPIFAQIASAIDYMHDHFLIHRDIKAENVFFADPKQTTVKVGDFGFATQVSRIDQHLTTFCGSPPYAAPELFQDDHYFGPSVDVWALGILLFFMVTGSMPFKGSTVAALKHAIIDGHFDMPDYLSQDCMEIINGILRLKPSLRMTTLQIRDSAWLTNIPWPTSDNLYRPRPLKRHSYEDMTVAEENVRSELKALGIDSELIENHVDRGSRSPVVGTFRILMHREVSDDWAASSDLDPSSSCDLSSRRSQLHSRDDHNNSKSRRDQKKKSKMCSLL